MKIIRTAGAMALMLAFSVNLASAGTAAPRISPPNSATHGKALTEWLGTYWTWYYGGVPADGMVDGVFMMPLPAGAYVSGSGTAEDPVRYKGNLEITVKPGTPFVLPLFAWVGERYNTGQADDPPMSNEVMLSGLNPILKIDGKTVITSANQAQFYIPPTYWDEMVVYPEPTSYGSIGAIFYQSVGFVSPPLSAGTHVISLYESAIFPPGAYPLFDPQNGFGLIYDNTWTIKVAPK